MRAIAPALLLVLALALAPARAEHCSWLAPPEVDAFGFYVDNSVCQPECLLAVAVYQETNNIAGLQREWEDPACFHPWEVHDTLILDTSRL